MLSGGGSDQSIDVRQTLRGCLPQQMGAMGDVIIRWNAFSQQGSVNLHRPASFICVRGEFSEPVAELQPRY